MEQGRARDRAWCHEVVVKKGWKARTDNKWAVYRGVRELSIEDGVREYGIGRHKVCCHYPREVVRIPEPTLVPAFLGVLPLSVMERVLGRSWGRLLWVLFSAILGYGLSLAEVRAASRLAQWWALWLSAPALPGWGLLLAVGGGGQYGCAVGVASGSI